MGRLEFAETGQAHAIRLGQLSRQPGTERWPRKKASPWGATAGPAAFTCCWRLELISIGCRWAAVTLNTFQARTLFSRRSWLSRSSAEFRVKEWLRRSNISLQTIRKRIATRLTSLWTRE